MSKGGLIARLQPIAFPVSVVVTVLLIPLLIIVLYPVRVDANISYFLETGRRILAGDLPYIDFFSENLLTIKFLSVLPFAVSELTGVNGLSVWLLFSWLGTVLSVACTCRMSVHIFGRNSSPHLSLAIPLSIAIMAWLSLFTTDFGQREHIFVLAAIPWLLCRYFRLGGGAIATLPAITIGFAAGLGATLKPHFLFLLVVVELYWLVRNGGRLRTTLDAGLLGFAVLPLANLAYLLLHPDALAGLYRWLVPYIASGRPNLAASVSAVNVARLLLPCFVAAIGLVLSMRRSGAEYRLLAGLAIFTVASGGIVILQSLREFYRLLPLYAGAFACCGLLLLLPLVSEASRRRYARSTGNTLYGGLVLLILLTTAFAWQSFASDSIATPQDLQSLLLEVTEPGDDVLFMTRWLGVKQPWLRIVDRNEANSNLGIWKPQLESSNELTNQNLMFQLDITRADIEASPAAIVVDRGASIRQALVDADLLKLIESRYQRVDEVQSYTVYAYVGAPPPQGIRFTLGEKFELFSWLVEPAQGAHKACDKLGVTTWWRPLTNNDIERFTIHVDMVKPGDRAVVEQFGRIGDEENYAAVSTIIDQRQLELPCGLEAGEYWLLLSLEDMSVEGGDVLPVRDSQGAEYGKYAFLRDIEIQS